MYPNTPTGKGGHGNKKIGTDTPANKMPDGSDVKQKTSGGKSAKSATQFKTH